MRAAKGDSYRTRAPHPRAQPDGQMKHRSSKDTNRWCLGKVGREHVGRFETYDFFAGRFIKPHYPSDLNYRCQNCRKFLKTDVTSGRAPWLYDDRGQLTTYNPGTKTCKAIPFYGPGLPPWSWR